MQALAVGVPVVLGGLVGSICFEDQATWYRTLKRPFWEPPPPVFGQVQLSHPLMLIKQRRMMMCVPGLFVGWVKAAGDPHVQHRRLTENPAETQGERRVIVRLCLYATRAADSSELLLQVWGFLYVLIGYASYLVSPATGCSQ